MTAKLRARIRHRRGCPKRRMEDHELTAPTGRWAVARCIDCGRQVEELVEAAAPAADGEDAP